MVSFILLSGVIMVGAGVFLLLFANHKRDKAERALYQAELKLELAKKEAASERREALLKLKDELHQRRIEFKNETRREQTDLERTRTKIMARFDVVEQRESELLAFKRELQQKEREVSRMTDQVRISEEKLKNLYAELTSKLEKVGNMTEEEARQVLFETLKSEVRHSNEKWLQKVEEEAKITAREKSMSIVIDAMQRYAAEQVSASSSSVVNLPNDDMKGRIIGKEGRNIKALEMATGMEFVIGDTPEVITISGFNPVRREVARRSLEKLVTDGRINPTRIEEVVAQTEREIDEIIQTKGKDAVMQLNLHGVAPDIITALGRLHFRTSFSQNVLSHSIEVAYMARMIAEEIGLPRPDLAARAGLFHDMGKAASSEHEGPHALVGADLAKRCGEDPIVVNAIAAHHEEVPFKTLYDPLIVIADTISASRPGARRETLTAYIKRLEKLESIAKNFEGVKKAYALQAGREIRIIVEEDVLGDQESLQLARDVAGAVETEMNFPGQIKVNVIREKRAIEYAK